MRFKAGQIIGWELDFPAEHWLLVLEPHENWDESIVIHYGANLDSGSYSIEKLGSAICRSHIQLIWPYISICGVGAIYHALIGLVGIKDRVMKGFISENRCISIGGGFNGTTPNPNLKTELDNWNRIGYNILNHNCQDFIKMIDVCINGSSSIETQADIAKSVLLNNKSFDTATSEWKEQD